MKQKWFEACLENLNRKKEEELIHKWSILATKIGGVFLISIFMLRLAIGL